MGQHPSHRPCGIGAQESHTETHALPRSGCCPTWFQPPLSVAAGHLTHPCTASKMYSVHLGLSSGLYPGNQDLRSRPLQLHGGSMQWRSVPFTERETKYPRQGYKDWLTTGSAVCMGLSRTGRQATPNQQAPRRRGLSQHLTPARGKPKKRPRREVKFSEGHSCPPGVSRWPTRSMCLVPPLYSLTVFAARGRPRFLAQVLKWTSSPGLCPYCASSPCQQGGCLCTDQTPGK